VQLEFRTTVAEVAERAYVVTVSGEADMYNAPELKAEFDAVLQDGARDVIVDLLEVPFLDSTVLGVLLRAARLVRSTGGELTIVSDDARILRVFEISGLNGYFRFDSSLAHAIERTLANAVVG
jgi:anti-sigma B factor antagonist